MNNKYQIWDKTSTVYTPVGEAISPEDWINRYQWINIPGAVPVVASGLMNGAYIGELSQMKTYAEMSGATFEEGLSDEELLDAIAAYEDELNKQAAETVSVEERTAAALEMLAIEGLPDAENS